MEYEQLPEYLTYLDAVMPVYLRIMRYPNALLRAAGIQGQVWKMQKKCELNRQSTARSNDFSSSVSRLYLSIEGCVTSVLLGR